jgi:hypothetical protein
MSFCLTNYLIVGRRDELFDPPLSVTQTHRSPIPPSNIFKSLALISLCTLVFQAESLNSRQQQYLKISTVVAT